MLDVQATNGNRLWLGVYAVKTVRSDGPAGECVVELIDGTQLTIKEEGHELVKRIRGEMHATMRP